MKKMIYVLVIFFLSLTLFSCAKKSDTSSTTTTTTELEGVWKTNCYIDSDNLSYYYITTISVTGTNLEIKDEIHSDSSCNTDDGILASNFSSLSIGEEISFSSGATGHKFTMNLDSIKYTPETTAAVISLLSDRTCGYGDWALNTEKDITGKTCGSLTIPGTIPVANTTYLSIYKLVGNNLYLGSFGTTGSYPDRVSNEPAYIKQ